MIYASPRDDNQAQPRLRSRNDRDFTKRYSGVAAVLREWLACPMLPVGRGGLASVFIDRSLVKHCKTSYPCIPVLSGPPQMYKTPRLRGA